MQKLFLLLQSQSVKYEKTYINNGDSRTCHFFLKIMTVSSRKNINRPFM